MTGKRIFIAGHNGMVGSALFRKLSVKNDGNLLLVRSRKQLDLLDQKAVRKFFLSEKIEQVYLAAAKVGGIRANNTYPADFIHQNLLIQSNVIHSAFASGVERLLFLGSSCIYPRDTDQPMVESQLLTGLLESTNEPYAIAKIAGIKLCESFNRQYGTDYRSVMPCNLYGPGDNYDPLNSHVIPGLLRRFHDAKISGQDSVDVWGSGRAKREFLFVDDMVEACIELMDMGYDHFWKNNDPLCSHVNIGSGREVSIGELAQLIKRVVHFEGEIQFDATKPDGTMRKVMSIEKIKSLTGWAPETSLMDGIQVAYADYCKQA